jgi:GAF domain-containing protein
VADRGDTALAQLRLDQPVVALIDLKLEDVSGLDLMREIKTTIPTTECIVLTGYASQTSAIEAVNLGAYGYMQKPYNVEQLLLMIRRAIEKRETELALQRVAELRQRLLQVVQSMFGTLAFDEVIQQIHQSLKELLTYDSFELYQLDDHAAVLRPLLIIGASWMPEGIRQQVIPLRQGLLGVIAQSGQARNVPNAHLDPSSSYPAGMTIPCEHILCIPLQRHNKTMGLFVISRNTDPPFTSGEFELAQLFTSFVSLALENARLFEQTTLSEKRYRTLFEESKDAIVVLSPTGHIRHYR